MELSGGVEADVGYSDDGWEVCGKVVSKEKASNNRQLNHTFKTKREKTKKVTKEEDPKLSIGLFLLYYTKFDRFLNQTGGFTPSQLQSSPYLLSPHPFG